MAKSYRFACLHVVGGVVALVALIGFAGTALSQNTPNGGPPGQPMIPQDPGVRGGPPGAGGALPGLGMLELNLFNAALGRFQEVDSVQTQNPIDDAPPNSNIQFGGGLGPRFNLNSCAGCHAQPAVGGTSPRVNPEVAVATLRGAKNSVPSFVTGNGPVREVRFINIPNVNPPTPDGGVHDLFVITGRSDARGCSITQPDFSDSSNIIFRIPTPVFGGGQVENTPDATLENDAATVAITSQRQASGISGNFNHSGNDGTITRFGWKAQNKSLLMFAGEAYNVEQGVTNELFPNERDDTTGCQFNQLPEDSTNLIITSSSGSPASDYSSDIVNFAAFMRLSAGPAPAVPATATAAASTTRGQQAFNNVGCNLCHIAQHTTGKSIFTGQSNVTFSPFSDFELHDMGTGLADQINQGQAEGDQFRTAPLWGIGQRIFFLHDGRTADLLQAIEAHMSGGSEANTVIAMFNALPAWSRQDILNFLRSL